MSDIDRDEKNILAAYERGEWRPVRDRDAEIDMYREYARETFKRGRRVNIPISGTDLEAIQRRAVHEGISCQSLMSNVLHEYASGRLVEGSQRRRAP